MGEREERKRQILDKLPRDLNESRIIPIRWSIDQPNKKFPTIWLRLQICSGDGDKIISPVGLEIVSFHNDATLLIETGFRPISEIDWRDGLKRALLTLLNELRFSFRRRYRRSAHKRTPTGEQTASAQEIENKIQSPDGRFNVWCGETEMVKTLYRRNQMGQGGSLHLFQKLDVAHRGNDYAERNVSELITHSTSVRGGNVNLTQTH